MNTVQVHLIIWTTLITAIIIVHDTEEHVSPLILFGLKQRSGITLTLNGLKVGKVFNPTLES